MTRPIVWVMPKPTNVVIHEPNPVLDGDDIILAPGHPVPPGFTLSQLTFKSLRFTFSRNYPNSNASEEVGDTYKIAAIGVGPIATFDIRYAIGTLTVVDVPAPEPAV